MGAILDKLERERIFDITIKDIDGKKYIRFEEACDGYFKCDLSFVEFTHLIEELKEWRMELLRVTPDVRDPRDPDMFTSGLD